MGTEAKGGKGKFRCEGGRRGKCKDAKDGEGVQRNMKEYGGV